MTNTKPYFKLILGGMIIGLIVSGIVSEAAFRLLGNITSREPSSIELIIPEGTAKKVAKGEMDLVESMIFVVGDVLTLNNQDSETHILGPLVVPPGTSASISLDKPENQRFSCSFNPNQEFGLDVREATTFSTRLVGILLAGLPLGFLISAYSIAAWPFTKKTTDETA